MSWTTTVHRYVVPTASWDIPGLLSGDDGSMPQVRLVRVLGSPGQYAKPFHPMSWVEDGIGS
jgi:hypothetical protein